jgi:DHA1 family inner membrane transport protein
VISLFGIIRFVPEIRKEQAVSLRQELRSLFDRRVLLMFLTGALGCASLFAVFTYITPMLETISGFAEHSVTWILVLFGCGVTIGNLLGGKLADWRLKPYLLAAFAILTVILAILAKALAYPVPAVVVVFLWGIAAFGIMPGIQIRIFKLAEEAPLLAATSIHSVLNLGNAVGAYLGGTVITNSGLHAVPWLGSALAALAFAGIALSFGLEKRAVRGAPLQNSA